MVTWRWYYASAPGGKCAQCKTHGYLDVEWDGQLFHVGCLLDKLAAGPAPLDIDLSCWEGPP